MALPYLWTRSLDNTKPMPMNMELEVSLSIADGIPLKMSANGKLTPVTAQADRPEFILNNAAQTSSVGTLVNLGATPPVFNQIGNGFNAQAGPGGNMNVLQLGGFASVLPVCYANGVWRCTFTPLIPARVATGASATSIVLPNTPVALGAGALVGGVVYCQELNQQAQITASSAVAAPGDPITLTIVSPLGQPGATIPATGLTFKATPLGRAAKSIKFSALVSVAADGYVPSQLGVGSADWSGGNMTVIDVDIQQGYVFVIFQ